MSKAIFKEKIKRENGYILSDGTHNYQLLLCKAYDLLFDFDIRTYLRKEIVKILGVPEDMSAVRAYYFNELPEADNDVLFSLWNDDVFYLLESLAPNGFYFGTLEGDGACFGWFLVEEKGV